MRHVLTIPEWSRASVKMRCQSRCERCGAPAPRGAWHHRRSRSVRDTHTHCPCNGVWLCNNDHAWVHANPLAARQNGFIVSRNETEPATVPVLTPWGERTHDCGGGQHYIPSITDNEEQP